MYALVALTMDSCRYGGAANGLVATVSHDC